MKNIFRKERMFFLILFASLIGIFLRLYNLNWGVPFYFHPDERNISSSITQLNFPTQLNPHFFAYGSFPIYLIYLTGILVNFFSSCQLSIVDCQLSFSQTIITSRFYSALLSILLIPSIYILSVKLKDKTTGIIAVFLTIFSTGLIQFAHFGTFEMWLTFLSVWFFYFCLGILRSGKTTEILFVGIILGLLIATKISSLILLPLPFFSIFLHYFSKRNKDQYTSILVIVRKLLNKTFSYLIIAVLIYILVSPFILFDYKSFISSIKYESSVAVGTLPVFYTEVFSGTIPIFFQFTKIYPFLINPFITILSIPSIIYIAYIAFKRKIPSYYLLFVICCLLFLSQAFLFAKWTRYIVPTIPFISLIVSISITDFLQFIKKKFILNSIKYFISGLIIFISAIFSISYFITVHTKTDSRILAVSWAKKNITSNAKILSEAYDPGIMAFNPYFSNITLFNFYDLDQSSTSDGGSPEPAEGHDSSEVKRLETVLSQNDYIIIPSQRVIKKRLLTPDKFSNGYNFYKKLMNGNLGFIKIYQTPCDIFCKITYLGSPMALLEETTSVFDRPTVFIFKRSHRQSL